VKRSALTLLLLVALLSPADAALRSYSFDHNHSVIRGWVKYTVLGRYWCAFRRFNGSIRFDPARLSASTVDLAIDVDSVSSTSPQLDELVRSPRLLDAAKFPQIIFKSLEIRRGRGDEYRVKGTLTMHGVTNVIEFPFYWKEEGGKISAGGQWVINRKAFGVVWHHILDRAGLIVGNHLTVDWRIKADLNH
jgi:polyisoprenoid-binding protein YceI